MYFIVQWNPYLRDLSISSKLFIKSGYCLRVLLAKWPEMSTPTFLAWYLFVCIIKSTYQVHMAGTKSWHLRDNTGPRGGIKVLGPRQKWVNRPPTFFQLVINFHLKLLFSVSTTYCAFSHLTWSKMKIFYFYHKTSIIPIKLVKTY